MQPKIFYKVALLFILISNINIESKNHIYPQEESYVAVAEVMPEIIGGLQELHKKISYPDFAKRAGMEGKVFVLAFINENGDVDDVKIIKGIGGGCDEEVAKAVKKTKFKPAMNKSVPVKAKFPVAFTFKLS